MPTRELHGLVAEDSDLRNGSACRWDKDLWQQVIDLGWLMVAVPERVGGMGICGEMQPTNDRNWLS